MKRILSTLLLCIPVTSLLSLNPIEVDYPVYIAITVINNSNVPYIAMLSFGDQKESTKKVFDSWINNPQTEDILKDTVANIRKKEQEPDPQWTPLESMIALPNDSFQLRTLNITETDEFIAELLLYNGREYTFTDFELPRQDASIIFTINENHEVSKQVVRYSEE